MFAMHAERSPLALHIERCGVRHPALRMLGNALFLFIVAQVDVSDHAAFAELALARLALYCGRLLEAVDANGFGNMLGVFGVRVDR